MHFPEALPVGWEVMLDDGAARTYGRSDGLMVRLEHQTSKVSRGHGLKTETIWRLRAWRDERAIVPDELQMVRELFFGKERAVFAFSTAAQTDPGDWIWTIFHADPDPLGVLDILESMTSQF